MRPIQDAKDVLGHLAIVEESVESNLQLTLKPSRLKSHLWVEDQRWDTPRQATATKLACPLQLHTPEKHLCLKLLTDDRHYIQALRRTDT